MFHDRRSNPVTTFLPEFRPAPSDNPRLPPEVPATTVQPRPRSSATSSKQFVPSLPSLLQKTISMFSIRSSLFFQPFSAPILCSQHVPASFQQNRGRRGITMPPKSFSVSYSRYLQCSQQNTNSCALFSAPSLCFHHFMNSLCKNTRGREGAQNGETDAAPKKMTKSSNAAYALFASDGGLHHAASPPCHRPGRRLRRIERRAKIQARPGRGHPH